MDSNRGIPSRFPLPEEFRLLCMLSNIGITTPNKSLTTEEISERISMELSLLEKLLPKLAQDGYVKVSKMDLNEKYHVTINGIRKVLSTYS